MRKEGGAGDNDSATQSNDQEAETDAAAAQVSLPLSLSLSLSLRRLSLAGIYLSDRRRGTDLPRSSQTITVMMEIWRMDVNAKSYAVRNGNFSAPTDHVYRASFSRSKKNVHIASERRAPHLENR